MSIEFPMEIGHIEEIEEQIVEQDDTETIILASEPMRQHKQTPSGQKIVYIQTPQGLTRAVRVQSGPNSAGGLGTPSGSGTIVQHVKSAGSAGSSGVVQVRRNVAPTRLVHRVAAPTVVKSANKPITVVKTAVASVKAPTTVTKTITMAQARQMGLISPTTGDSPSFTVKAAKPEVKILNSSPAVTAVRKVVVGGAKATQESSPKVVELLPETPVIKSEPGKFRVSNQTAERLVQLPGAVVMPGGSQQRVVMLPPTYMDHMTEEVVEMSEIQEVVDENDIIEQSTSPTPTDLGDLTIKKRPCNCTKSQCLKLYCECFANGEFCSDCNCKECFNTLDHEDDRQAAIYACLERNPNAFRPKIGKISNAATGLRHHKGCHCKRSGCLKNYCECFEAKIPCTDMCKCVDCKNSDEHTAAIRTPIGGAPVSAIKRAAAEGGEIRSKPIEDEDEPPPKQPYNFMTAEVVDATVQCMMAQADECQQNGVSFRNAERLILEEFGRCLGEIIEFSQNQESE